MRRLDAESLRDSILLVSDKLNHQMHGPSVFPRLSGSVVAGQSRPGLGWQLSTEDQRARRSVYVFVKRGLRDPLLESFDYVNTAAPIGSRPTTTVAPQALLLLNSRFTREQTEALAGRIIQQVGSDSAKQIEAVYVRMLSRPPRSDERKLGLRYLERQLDASGKARRQLRFAPDVPVSLFRGYRAMLSAADYIDGPAADWDYYRGLWGAAYEEIEVVDVSRGPFALWRGAEFADANLTGKITLEQGTEHASLLVRAIEKEDSWEGVEVRWRPRMREVAIVQQPSGQQLARCDLEITAEKTYSYRIELTGPRLRFWVDPNGPPIMDVKMEGGPSTGRFGVAAWGNAVLLDETVIEHGGDKIDIASPRRDERWVQRQALAAFCQVILNLNEFIYVD